MLSVWPVPFESVDATEGTGDAAGLVAAAGGGVAGAPPRWRVALAGGVAGCIRSPALPALQTLAVPLPTLPALPALAPHRCAGLPVVGLATRPDGTGLLGRCGLDMVPLGRGPHGLGSEVAVRSAAGALGVSTRVSVGGVQ